MTYYSRRQLEALGEPLGDSVTRKEGGRIIYGGGGSGGGGGPTQTTTYSTNIPEYARPYVENMLESTQKQIYTDDMSTFRPYRPYSTNVQDYVAGFSPLQQQAQQAAYGLQTPGQFGTGTNLAGAAGMGGLGAAQQAGLLGQQALGYGATGAQYGATGAEQALARAQQTGRQAGMYGRMGAGYGARGVQAAEQGFGAGEAFARQATDPYATQAYMSPYMQNVVDYQKMQALRDYQIGQPMRRAQAIGAGAFGGSRQAIAESEAERNLMSQLQGIQATGSQKAFEDAQRQQQFGAQLGLQGLQAGYGGLGLGMQGAGLGLQGVGAQQAAGQLGLAGTAQGMQGAQAGLQGVQGAIGAGQLGLGGLGAATQAAGTLGQLGGQQLGAQKEIIGLQSQMGAQQQALEQQKINQAIQDYAIAQQYPFMQLGMMNAMLRGLPLQTQTTQLYQAQPTSMQQGIGLLGAGASLFGGRREGGAIKEYREGGITQAYAPGGKVNTDSEAVGNIQTQLASMDVNELRKVAATNPSEQIREMANELLVQKEAAAAQAQKARMSGIAMAGGPAFETINAAGGGIIAFREGGYSNEELEEIARGQGVFPEGSPALPGAEVTGAASLTPKKKETAEKRSDRFAVVTGPKTLTDFFNQQKELGPKGQYGEEFEKFLGDYVGDPDRLSRKERMAAAKGFLKFASTPAPGGIGQAAAAGLSEYATGVEAARDAEDKIKFETAKVKSDLEKARRAEARGDVDAAQKAYDSAANRDNQIKVAQMQLAKSSEFERQYEAFKNDPVQFEKFRRSLTAQDDTARLNAYVKADTALAGNTKYLQLINSKKPEDQAKAEKMRSDKITEYLGALGISQAPTAAAPAAPQMGTDGTVTIPGMGRFKQLPNGNYVKV